MKKTLFLLLLGSNFPNYGVGVHVFGDSHASFSFSNVGKLSSFEDSFFIYNHHDKSLPLHCFIHWLGPKTMHSVGREGLNFLNIKKWGVGESDIAVFVFGEIDVRCHIGKQRDLQHRNLSDIIDELVFSYVRTVMQNRALYNNLNCVIMQVLPPCNQCYSPEFPFWGSLEDRVNIAQQLNAKLRECCEKYSILLLEIYDLLATESGAFNVHLSDGCVHVQHAHNYLIKNKLVHLLIEQQILKI